MIDSLRQLPERYPATRRYLIGVSGGLDSVVLLHALKELAYHRLIVVHLNHALRGRQSGADAAFVRRLAKSLGYDFEGHREAVRRAACERKLSLETAARHARYAFFAHVAKRRRCRTLFLAHHADDQVETVLMNLFRGTGSSGLGGMRAASRQTVNGTTLEVIRPLLGLWRGDLLDYAAARPALRYREDASNQDRQFLRNRVRHELMPHLKAVFGRDVRSAILRLADQSRAESACLDALVPTEADEPNLSVAGVRGLPLALQRRLIHRWLKNQGVANLDFALVNQVLRLIPVGAESAKINLPGDRHLRRRKGILFIDG